MQLELSHPLLAAASLLLAAIVIALIWRSRHIVGKPAAVILSLAALSAALAASMPRLSLKTLSTVNVLLDLSPSTRTADYRDHTKLDTRLHELIPNARYHITTFGENASETILPPILEPTVLFSDGQFPTTNAVAPVFCIIDPKLENAVDASIETVAHERGKTIAIVTNNGSARTLTTAGESLSIPTGTSRVDLGSAFRAAAVHLNPADAWPENDALTSPAQPPPGVNRLCVGLSTPPGFESHERVDLPEDASTYLSTALLVLDAGDAAKLTPAQQSAIATWVRDLGGSLLLVGTDAAWAEMRQTPIEQLSPLSVDPPTPQAQWVILMDASGSMTQIESGKPKWQYALNAAAAAARALPANDAVRLGSFSADVRWWQVAPANELRFTPPEGFAPHGPTNLEAALKSILALPPSDRRQVLILTDAEIDLPDWAKLADEFRARSTPVNCLAFSDGRGIAVLRQFTSATAGRMVSQSNPAAWPAASQELAHQLAPSRWHTDPIAVTLTAPLSASQTTLPLWNSAWPRQGATIFASSHQTGISLDLAATWQIALGTVTTIAFPNSATDLATLAPHLEHLPTDPRFHVQWLDHDRLLRVEGSATKMLLRVSANGNVHTSDLPQIAPHLFQAPFQPPTTGGQIALLANTQIISARTFAPRYPPEFNAIGINRESLSRLAQRTGGQLIELSDTSPLPLRLTPFRVSLAPWFGLACCTMLVASVLLLRQRV